MEGKSVKMSTVLIMMLMLMVALWHAKADGYDDCMKECESQCVVKDQQCIARCNFGCTPFDNNEVEELNKEEFSIPH